jgi:hypothetical protein
VLVLMSLEHPNQKKCGAGALAREIVSGGSEAGSSIPEADSRGNLALAKAIGES